MCMPDTTFCANQSSSCYYIVYIHLSLRYWFFRVVVVVSCSLSLSSSCVCVLLLLQYPCPTTTDLVIYHPLLSSITTPYVHTYVYVLTTHLPIQRHEFIIQHIHGDVLNSLAGRQIGPFVCLGRQ